MEAMTSFYAEKCCHLVSLYAASARLMCMQQRPPISDLYTTMFRVETSLDTLGCPLSVTERFLLLPLVCGTVFHRTSLLPALSPSFAVVLNHISAHFLIPLSDLSLICTLPSQ